jgi:hypothetical protein
MYGESWGTKSPVRRFLTIFRVYAKKSNNIKTTIALKLRVADAAEGAGAAVEITGERSA